MSAYLARKAAIHRDLKSVKKKIRDGLPGNPSRVLPEAVRAALLIDLDTAKTVERSLESYPRAFGVAAVDQRFPG